MTPGATAEEQSIPAQQPDFKELQDIIKQTNWTTLIQQTAGDGQAELFVLYVNSWFG